MLYRFESSETPDELGLEPRSGKRKLSHGRLTIILLTILYLIWLFVRVISQPDWLSDLPPVVAELMQAAELAGLLTLGVLWGVLWWHGRRQKPEPVPPLDREKLYALNPYDFERYVADLFRNKGYRVQLRGRSGDAGVDLMLTQRSGKRAIVQCKRYRRAIGPDIVRELYGTLVHERVSHAFLVTTADISDSAREWAQGKPITLIDGDSLAHIAAVLDQAPDLS